MSVPMMKTIGESVSPCCLPLSVWNMIEERGGDWESCLLLFDMEGARCVGDGAGILTSSETVGDCD